MNKNAFSLIEVIIATGIITITVFGVYKLIGENNKIISGSGNYLQVNSLFPVLEECIENIGINGFANKTIGANYQFILGNSGSLDGCAIGTIPELIIDNKLYNLKGEIINAGSNFIEWNLYINSDEVKTMTGNYILIK